MQLGLDVTKLWCLLNSPSIQSTASVACDYTQAGQQQHKLLACAAIIKNPSCTAHRLCSSMCNACLNCTRHGAYSAQRKLSPQEQQRWRTVWLPVALKRFNLSDARFVEVEVGNLQWVQAAQNSQAGPRHIVDYVDAFKFSGGDCVTIVTR